MTHSAKSSMWLIGVFIACTVALGPAHASATLEGVVTRVTDGDTVWVRPADGGRPVKVRVQGIDAPEICQAGGREAQQALAAMALHRTVRVDSMARDDYGRTIGRLRRGDADLGRRMVAEGQAWSHRYRGDVGPYMVQERRAREQQRGLFSDPQAELPREFRKRHGPCS